MPKIESLLSNLALKNEKKLIVAISQWFDSTQKQIRKDLTEKFQKSFAVDLTDWEFIEKDGITKIKPASLEIFKSGGNAAYKYLAIEGAFDVVNVRSVKSVNEFCSQLVKEVSKNTKKGINVYVQAGIKEGKSMPKIAKELKPLVGLTQKQSQAVINYGTKLQAKKPNITAAQLDKAKNKYANKLHRQRVQTIARTETARAQNIGYCQGLEDVGVEKVEFSVSPAGCCETCASMNGEEYSVKEGSGIIPVHPNCLCALLPVIGAETISRPAASPPVIRNYTDTVSENFKTDMDKLIQNYPNSVKKTLSKNNIKINIGKKLTEIHPELKGRHPRGWPRGSTWDSAEGIFHTATNSVSVAETYRPIGQKIYQKVSKTRAIGVLNHETGHAINRSFKGMYSESEIFKKAYRNDIRNLTQYEIATNRLRYFMQRGSAGRDETFAEIFANILGQGASKKEIIKFFPNCTKIVRGFLK